MNQNVYEYVSLEISSDCLRKLVFGEDFDMNRTYKYIRKPIVIHFRLNNVLYH